MSEGAPTESTRDDLPIDPELLTPAVTGPDSFAPPTPSRHRRWDVALVIAAGGALGGGARWLVNQALPSSPGGFPWSTFVENVTGCFLLAVVMVFLVDVWPPHRYARPFIGIGVLGGYTTFSAYTWETQALLDAGQAVLALTYLFGSVAGVLLAVVAGLSLTRKLAGVTPPHQRKEPL
ncbi:MAG TPA: CrcB family protein [Candidatus Limnocylindrales bacterium]|nr:CrcB family protein [Candidatus Limnocylindrales bacterium]